MIFKKNFSLLENYFIHLFVSGLQCLQGGVDSCRLWPRPAALRGSASLALSRAGGRLRKQPGSASAKMGPTFADNGPQYRRRWASSLPKPGPTFGRGEARLCSRRRQGQPRPEPAAGQQNGCILSKCLAVLHKSCNFVPVFKGGRRRSCLKSFVIQ